MATMHACVSALLSSPLSLSLSPLPGLHGTRVVGPRAPSLDGLAVVVIAVGSGQNSVCYFADCGSVHLAYELCTHVRVQPRFGPLWNPCQNDVVAPDCAFLTLNVNTFCGQGDDDGGGDDGDDDDDDDDDDDGDDDDTAAVETFHHYPPKFKVVGSSFVSVWRRRGRRRRRRSRGRRRGGGTRGRRARTRSRGRRRTRRAARSHHGNQARRSGEISQVVIMMRRTLLQVLLCCCLLLFCSAAGASAQSSLGGEGELDVTQDQEALSQDPNLVNPQNKQGYGKNVPVQVSKLPPPSKKATTPKPEQSISEQTEQAILQFGVLVGHRTESPISLFPPSPHTVKKCIMTMPTHIRIQHSTMIRWPSHCW